MKCRSWILLCLRLYLLPFSLTVLAQNPSDGAAVDVATKTIRPSEIRAHIRFLADSLLQGRAPGTPGYDIAARYVATELEGMGLHPGVSRQLVSASIVGESGHGRIRQFLGAHGEWQRTETGGCEGLHSLTTWFASPAGKDQSKSESDVNAPARLCRVRRHRSRSEI